MNTLNIVTKYSNGKITATMKKRKYTYWRVLQQNGGNGWDDIEHFDLHDSTLTERKLAALEYIKNMPDYSYRWISRRELNNVNY